MAVARGVHSAVLLPDGRVLVAGGFGAGSEILAGAELYDPNSGSWSSTGSLGTPRDFATASLLRSGKVLVVADLTGGKATVEYKVVKVSRTLDSLTREPRRQAIGSYGRSDHRWRARLGE